MPAGRELPAVTKNRNYPQPVKHLNPTALHFNYYAVPGNIDLITAFRDQIRWHWIQTLRRRSQRHRMTWERYSRIEKKWLPPARIVRPHPSVSFAARTQGRSPVR